MAKVLIPLAQGCEELEAVTLIDVLRRAGIEVVSAGLTEREIIASRGVRLLADVLLDEVLDQDFDLLVLPGGLQGAKNLEEDARITTLLQRQQQRGGYNAAICAAPVVLAKAGILSQKSATSYPHFLDQLNLTDVDYIDNQAVVVDGTIITSRGPATAMAFALTLVELLTDKNKRAEVAAGLLY
jgi:4-methyl-5(b-hydroxyethyl)-thiazole monophosphate biosynthesis